MMMKTTLDSTPSSCVFSSGMLKQPLALAGLKEVHTIYDYTAELASFGNPDKHPDEHHACRNASRNPVKKSQEATGVTLFRKTD